MQEICLITWFHITKTFKIQVLTKHDRVHLQAQTFNHIQSLLKLPGFAWDHCFAISAENAVALNCKNKLFVCWSVTVKYSNQFFRYFQGLCKWQILYVWTKHDHFLKSYGRDSHFHSIICSINWNVYIHTHTYIKWRPEDNISHLGSIWVWICHWF